MMREMPCCRINAKEALLLFCLCSAGCVWQLQRVSSAFTELFLLHLYLARSLQCAMAGAERRVPEAITALGQSGFVG